MDNLCKSAIETLISAIMRDLEVFLTEGLDNNTYNYLWDSPVNVDIWLEYFEDDMGEEIKQVIEEAIHEALGEMSIWVYDSAEQLSIINKISSYFAHYQIESNKFKDMVISIYQNELKDEWDF